MDALSHVRMPMLTYKYIREMPTHHPHPEDPKVAISPPALAPGKSLLTGGAHQTRRKGLYPGLPPTLHRIYIFADANPKTYYWRDNSGNDNDHSADGDWRA